MNEQDDKKRRAALAAMSYLSDGIVLGVGTGSTVNFFIDALQREKSRLEAVVSSSAQSTARLRAAGFEVVELADVPTIDLYVDGADEATKHRHLIKGGGGALTGEKILAAAARRFVCIIDESKLVGQPLVLTGNTTDGAAFNWAAYRGKVVLVDFWATWCGPCRREMPNVKALYEKHKAKGFEVVGVSLDKDLDALADAGVLHVLVRDLAYRSRRHVADALGPLG